MLKHAYIIITTRRSLHGKASGASVLIRRQRRFLSGDTSLVEGRSSIQQRTKEDESRDDNEIPETRADKDKEESGVEGNRSTALASKLFSHPPLYRLAQPNIQAHSLHENRSVAEQSNSAYSGKAQGSKNSILGQATYEEVLKGAQEAMALSDSDPAEIQRRIEGWWKGKKKKRDGVKDSASVLAKREETEKIRDSRRARVDGEDGRLRGSALRDASQSDIKATSSEVNSQAHSEKLDSINPHAKYLLPIYKPFESLRIARTRRNDLRNLSFLQAESRLGMMSELYNGTFASGKTRGGTGERTEEWRRWLEVKRFERETGEKATWLREEVEERRAKQRKKRIERWAKKGKQRKMKKDSFTKVWGDLASALRVKPVGEVSQYRLRFRVGLQRSTDE